MSLRIGYGTSNRNVRTGYGPGNSFLPNQVPGLVAWFDATAISGLNDSDPVTTWTNLAGSTNATGSGLTRPSYKVNIQNGRPGVLFTGSSTTNLRADAIAPQFSGNDTPCTIVIVMKPTDVTAAAQGWVCMCQEAVTPPLNNLDMATGAFRSVRRDDANTTFAVFNQTTVVANTPYITSYQFDGTNMQLFVNGVQSGSTTDVSAAGQITLDVMAIGVRRSGGANSLPYTGYMFEILIYNRAITTAERDKIELYASAKWGITVA